MTSRTVEPKRLEFDVQAASDRLSEGARGKVFVFPDGDARYRARIIVPRAMAANGAIHIVPRKQNHYLYINLSEALKRATGNGAISILSEPFTIGESALITFAGDSGQFLHVGDVVPASAIIWPLDVTTWIAMFGPPYESRADFDYSDILGSTRKNFAALKTSWPVLKDCRLTLSGNPHIPVPDAEHRRRVEGKAVASDPDAQRFLGGGANLLKSVLNIADVYRPCSLSGEEQILDWGVGCGRMARHMPEALQGVLVGADIDPVNISWCAQNVPYGRYEVLDPYAKTPFSDREFGLIYSHSVFTHLSEADQFFWLSELNRICSGLMILSVNGAYHAAKVAVWAATTDGWFAWLERGFETSFHVNSDISDIVAQGYYTGVAHTPDYIREKWSHIVEVIDILPGGFGGQHDAVVCRPREHKI